MEGVAEDGQGNDAGDGRQSVRRRVRKELGDERFVAAVRRRTYGTPTQPEATERDYVSLGDLPARPFDQSAIRTELTVFSESRVYRWVAAGGSVDLTDLPRNPGGFADER